ncbi:MAG: amidohydrolase family protein [Clostridia bacterium]|nr:amidohydrolase family protein [Clostridia bacterium]
MNFINAKIFDGEKMIEKGYLSFSNGVITAVGEMKDFEGEGTDMTGKFIFPGLIDAHTHIGMWGDSLGFEGDDGNEDTDPITPHLLGSDGVKIFDRCFSEALEAGVTTVLTGPGSANPAGGIYAVYQTAGAPDGRLYKEYAGLKIAFGENPKGCYKGKERGPVTRMATAALLREMLEKAKRYENDCKKAEADSELDAPDYDIKLETVSRVMRERLPVFAHAHQAEDILSAIKLAKEFCLNLVIVHGTDGAAVKDILAREKIAVLSGPVLCDRSKPELKSLSPKTAGELNRAGVKTAIITDHPVIPIQYLPLCAAVSVKHGLDKIEAYKALTSNPAEICGIEKKGRLKEGFDADIAVFSGDPLDVMTSCEQAYIKGNKVL